MTASLTDVFPPGTPRWMFFETENAAPTHSAAARPLTCGGLNFQARAAASARFAKYVLGPRETNFASETLPDASTETSTTTLRRPWIVFCAFCETSGMIRFAHTAPRSSRWRGLCLSPRMAPAIALRGCLGT